MILITLVILVSVTCAKGRINPGGPTVVEDFLNCMDHLIEYNFNETGLMIFANSQDQKVSTSVSRIRTELLTRIHARIKYPVKIMQPNNQDFNICNLYEEYLGILHVDRFQIHPFAAYFIIIIDKYADFPFLLSKLVRSRSWNPTAKFIILLLNFSTVNNNIRHVEEMLSCLFKYNVIDVMVIVPEPDKIRNAIVYSWKPFDPPKYCGHSNETANKRLYVYNKCVKGQLLTLDNTKTITIPNDMKGCVLYIIALQRQPFISDNDDDANLERILVDELVKKYNFKAHYDIMNIIRGAKIGGNWTGAFKELASKRGQILLGGIFPDDDVHEDFECSIGYLSDSYAWVLPKANKSAMWKALSHIFQSSVWYCIIAGFILSAIFWRTLGQLSGDTTYNKSLDHCFLNCSLCLMGYCPYLRPRTPSLRLFFSFFSLYCTTIITAYQTKLIDVLKNPTYEFQIENVNELIDSGLKFGGAQELGDLFSDPIYSDPMDKIINKSWINVVDNKRALIDVAVNRNFSVLCSRLELADIAAVRPELSDVFGNKKYYAFEDSVFSVPLEMVGLRGFAFMKKFSKTIGEFKQAGITERIRQRFKSFNEQRKGKLLQNILKKSIKINKLTMQHLQIGFIILAFGYIGGTILFLLEIIVNKTCVQQKIAETKQKFYHRKMK